MIQFAMIPNRLSARPLGILTLILASVACLSGCQPDATSLANDAAHGSKDNASDKSKSQDTSATFIDGSVPATRGFELQAAEPADVLARMARVYRNASSYADAGQIRFDLQLANQPDANPQLLNESVTFARPNRARIQCLDAMIVSDGKKIRASVESIPNQVLEIGAPAKLQITSLFAGDGLYDSLANGPAGFPIQLALLMGDQPLQSLAPEGSTLSMLSPDTFDGHTCRRVKVATADGARVYWIDAENYVLRLVELPTDAMRKQMEGERPIKRLSINVEFIGASLNQQAPDVAFQFEAPTDAKLVKQLIGPPPPLASELLGKSIDAFAFTGIDSSVVTQKSIGGKVTVLDFWFTTCGPCRQSFPLLNQVYEKYKDSDAVKFVSVSIDGAEVDSGTIQDTAKSWGGTFPLARDTQGDAEKKFQVKAAPTLIVLDAAGVVQQHEVGLNPQLATELPATIEAILAGKSTWADAKNREQRLVDDYERKIQTPAPTVTALEPLPETKILPRDEPKSLKLAQRWKADGLKAPGNILVIDTEKESSRVFVMDGPRTVVEIDREGKTVAKHELAIPAEAVVNFLRTAIDREGHRYFAGSASGQQQMFLFDADWKLLVGFPGPHVDKHAGIGDVQFTDFKGDGNLQLAVGYWGQVGVQGVSLGGARLWTDRSMEFVLRLAMGSADDKGNRTLLCTNSSGTLVPIDATGKPGAAWQAPGLMLETVVSADSGDGQTAIGAMARDAQQNPVAVGFGPRGEDLWHYPLPRGIFRTPVEPLTAARLLAGGKHHWLLAGADGSIHIVAAGGTPVDSFHNGSALTGLAGVRFGDASLLLLSTAKGLEAWEVTADK